MHHLRRGHRIGAGVGAGVTTGVAVAIGVGAAAGVGVRSESIARDVASGEPPAKAAAAGVGDGCEFATLIASIAPNNATIPIVIAPATNFQSDCAFGAWSVPQTAQNWPLIGAPHAAQTSSLDTSAPSPPTLLCVRGGPQSWTILRRRPAR